VPARVFCFAGESADWVNTGSFERPVTFFFSPGGLKS